MKTVELILATLLFISMLLVCFWILIEALHRDRERMRFLQSLKIGSNAMLGNKEVVVISIDKEEHSVLVMNVYQEPFWVDITELSSPEKPEWAITILWNRLKSSI
jgi:flagellar biogenesis protein FliO